MNSHELETGDISVPRWVQVPVGLLLLALTLLCLVGSATLIFQPNAKAPLLAPALGVVWVFACFWVLEKCFRLITGRRNVGGLMSPRSLRAVAWLFLLLPVASLFTGYFLSHPIAGTVQAVAYFGIFVSLRALASRRERDAA